MFGSRPREESPRDRGGPVGTWWVVLLVLIAGVATMGWAIYELIRQAVL